MLMIVHTRTDDTEIIKAPWWRFLYESDARLQGDTEQWTVGNSIYAQVLVPY